MKKTTFKKTNNNMEDNINQFSNMNESDLMSQLKKYAKEGKQNGSINDESLEKFFSVAQGFMNENEKQKLKELIDVVKST